MGAVVIEVAWLFIAVLIPDDAVSAPPAEEVTAAEEKAEDIAPEDMATLFVLEAGMLEAGISELGVEDMAGPAGDEAGMLAEFMAEPAKEADIMLV